jgi:hypothetical protein
MTTFRQIQANRRNALNSTGPNTTEGKEKSRCNAVRHGLTAETVIGALEDAEDYKAFEAAIIADYDAQSAVERELVLRLASLLWRLRRATTMETGLFEIQIEHLHAFRRVRQGRLKSMHLVPGRDDADRASVPDGTGNSRPAASDSIRDRIDPTTNLAHCFLHLADLPNYALDRLSRYEAVLWRQAAQILFALDALGRRRPQERGRYSYFRSRQERAFEERD